MAGVWQLLRFAGGKHTFVAAARDVTELLRRLMDQIGRAPSELADLELVR